MRASWSVGRVAMTGSALTDANRGRDGRGRPNPPRGVGLTSVEREDCVNGLGPAVVRNESSAGGGRGGRVSVGEPSPSSAD
jgi:hypothetical protein